MVSAESIPADAQAVLGLLGTAERQPVDVSQEQWPRIDALAQEHRLRPHLHGRLRRGEVATSVPPEVAAGWREAHHAAGLYALGKRRELSKLAALLAGEGIPAIALKGSWLAWHAYPAPAERPLRDLDILVAPKDAAKSLETLIEHGLKPSEPLPDDPHDFAIASKQFPPLKTASGNWVELHSHLWEPPGSMEWPTPPLCDEQMTARATPASDIVGLHYLDATDMLAHLAVHAAYSHRFEVGPLLLSDIDFLVGSGVIDWDRLWQEARVSEYKRGLALVIAVVDHWRRPGLMQESHCPLDVSSEAIANASALLCQPLDARQSTRSLAAWNSAREHGGLASAIATTAARASQLARNPVRLAQRLGESLTSLKDEAVSDSARRSAAMGQWLKG